MIHQGGNSGYQAINLAHLWGARRIVLLGLDCGNGPAGEAHWFGQHPAPLGRVQPFDLWRAKFPALAADLAADGVRVVNASRRTSLTCFRVGSLELEIESA